MSNIQQMHKRYFLSCACPCGRMISFYYDKKENTKSLTIYNTHTPFGVSIRHEFWSRIKSALQVLKGMEMFLFDILLPDKEIKPLKQWFANLENENTIQNQCCLGDHEYPTRELDHQNEGEVKFQFTPGTKPVSRRFDIIRIIYPEEWGPGFLQNHYQLIKPTEKKKLSIVSNQPGFTCVGMNISLVKLYWKMKK